jgi:hypothetical protein
MSDEIKDWCVGQLGMAHEIFFVFSFHFLIFSLISIFTYY